MSAPKMLAPKRDSRDDIHSAVENENTHLLNLQVSRYCPLVLQSCTVAAVPSLSVVSCVRALLVE